MRAEEQYFLYHSKKYNFILFANVNYVTFAICHRNSVCRLSVCLSSVCDVGAPYSAG